MKDTNTVRVRRSKSAPSPRKGQSTRTGSLSPPYRRRATHSSTKAPGIKPTGGHEAPTNAQQTISVSKPGAESIWKLTSDSLHPVPRFYPVSKSSIRVSGESADILAERVSTFFRDGSISAKYEDGCASVEATTRDHLEFNVAMWNGGIDGAGPNSEIIVEVQKIRGDSVQFHALCGALLKAIKGEEPVQDANHDARNIPNTNWESLWGALNEEINEEPSGALNEEINKEPSGEAVDALYFVLDMLESAHVDSNQLGLEYMCFLTNVGTVLRADAVFMSHAFLFGEEKTGLRLRDCIMSHIAKKEALEPRRPSDDEELLATTGHEGSMRNLAMQVLANAFGVAAAEGMLSSEFSTLPRFWFGVISNLVDVLGEASTFPHDATLSATCLSHLIQCSTGDERRELERRTIPPLTEAYRFGKERYRLLELTSLELLRVMDLEHVEFA